MVDAAKSTLYVFENHKGTARDLADYYISSGKNGIDKLQLADRTATGEDRRHVIEAFAAPGSTRVATAADGSVTGFVIYILRKRTAYRAKVKVSFKYEGK